MLDLATVLPATRADEDEHSPILPPQPRNVHETGLELQLVVELIAKAIFTAGRTHLPILATRLRLSVNVLREALDFMVAEQLAEVAWRGDADIDVQYQLTSIGKQRAGVWLERAPYQGPAPVTLDSYRSMAARQAARLALGGVMAGDVDAVFADCCLDPGVHRLAGAAMHAGRSMLLYGPPGSGKSMLARKLGGLLAGVVLVPHAVAVGREIVQLYDPAIHLPPTPATGGRLVPERRSGDARWMLCQRPVVHLGAELDGAMLELRHDAFSGCYQAPAHCKASHGLVIIDDLGRQRIAAPALLNRFIQPLDAGQDQLALAGGYQFAMPFHAMLVFATNLPPQVLLDASALRRLGYKVHVGALSDHTYCALFRKQCRVANVAVDEAALRYLVDELHGGSGQPLLASYPREILARLVDFASYGGLPPQLTEVALEQAWTSMFGTASWSET